MSIALSQESDSSLIRMDEVVDITTASELKTALLLALEAGKPIHLSLQSVTEFDVTAYQLLWVAEHQAKQAGTEFSIMDLPPESVVKNLAEMGLDGVFLKPAC
jgi:anti-anti-sigma regulatory factor